MFSANIYVTVILQSPTRCRTCTCRCVWREILFELFKRPRQQHVEKCMSSMQTGTQMVKLRGGSKGLVRFYYLDEHKSCIRWRPSRKNERAKISIDSIREVCEGKQSEIFQRYSDGSFDPNCCFSIYYGEHMESLDLVSTSGEEARTWITGLKYLVAGISDEDSLAKRQRTRDQWLKQTFAEADKNGDGSLSISEVLQLLHKLNVNLPRQKVKQMFKEADTDENQGTLGFEEFCTFYKMMSTRRDLYLLMLTYSNHKDHMDTDNLIRFLEVEQKMTNVTKEHCLEIVSKFEPCPENQQQGVLGIDGFTNYMRSPSGDIFNPEHYEVTQDMTQPLCNYFIASSHNTYLMGDQLMSQSRVDMYAWVLQAGCRCVEVDCWDGQDGEPIVHHGYTLTSKILFKDVIETINKYAFVKNPYPVILSIENHCSVPQQKKMAQYLMEVLGDKLDLSTVNMDESGLLPSPEGLKGKILVKGKKLPSNIDEDAEEGDVSDEDSADEMEDDCKLMNGDTSMNRKQVENVAKKKLDSLMKESKIRDREDPDSFTIAALPPSGKLHDPTLKGKSEDGTDTADEANPNTNKRVGRSFMGSFSKRKKKTAKLKKTSSLEDTDTDQESSSSASKAPLHHSRKKKTMKLSRALSDLVKYTKSVGVHDIEAQASACSWQVSSFSETKAHQTMQQKPAQFIHFNQRQLSRIYPSSYRVDSSNFNPQPFWNSGCHLVALNYQSEGRVLQLNRAKFYSNGNCGYILKPPCMCEGAFNPMLDDPLPNRLKKQLVLKIISGQQLPKPKDSMLGDRGEIIDPFVEVEIIGLPVDCCKEQTRVVDDNGFNPMWEETLVFTLHMPEIALVRFLVWDHDPIGQDFIGQRSIAFTSMMPGYRHVYLEGMEEASIFVHVAVNEISGKVRPVSGIKGLFHRNPKQASLDSHAAAHLARKPTFGAHLLRRTASAPTKGQPKVKKGFPEISIDTKDYSSEGASEDRESEDASRPRFDSEGDRAAPHRRDGTNGELHPGSDKDDPTSVTPPQPLETIAEESEERNPSRTTSVSGPPDPLHPTPPAAITPTPPPPAPHHGERGPQNEGEEVSPCPPADSAPSGTANAVLDESSAGRAVDEEPGSHGNTEPRSPTPDLTPRPRTPPLNQDGQGQGAPGGNASSDEEGSVIGREAGEAPPPPVESSSQRGQAVRALRSKELASGTPGSPRAPVRRTKSEGHVRAACSAGGQWAVPEVCTDATANDRLWSRLDASSQRDSVSSSSSLSSNDTVIDLSLPNLARKSLPCLNGACREPEEGEAGRPRAAAAPRVTKSKSNPNLRGAGGDAGELADELQPRPLAKEPRDAGRLMQRRHTWSRLYMEGLRQASSTARKPAASAAAAAGNNADASGKSKSLGDLTSDDFACNFDSKYRSISRSFISRPSRDPRRPRPRAQDDLQEQLRRLTDVEPLSASDFARKAEPEEEEEEEAVPLRRSSSRSQSRVRYIANRAKQAQERQRLQGLARHGGSPIEERGNPEGACSVARSPCASLDLLSQLPAAPPAQSASGADDEVFFTLKL
ncbi:1-phosphatidylinositol 4,5-bisphosphate phosphodiesterase eta-2a isoform X2 [Anguilla anguilla]|uniref:1-phosphatidylinositol 4,5-bisphosphate phosphodiesterase eta-2a isoform X2 n=1 Tax=Anguilla anguilla TaxID=7936 RepID=UPI0015B31863|nr:1-phosphatidylinositol 4,5-bisphosphate phosphodiesterase eta-2a isoform X2 [Anguilla anguilla]